MNSDLFGLLPLPFSCVVNAEKSPAGDPLLEKLLGFMQAVVNEDLGELWRQICPADPIPVLHTDWHNPDPTTFSVKNTPALYAWRGAASDKSRFSQGYTSDETPVQCLWVPPVMKQEMLRISQPFSQALKLALKDAFVEGRHPAWQVQGDDYYHPEFYGSVLVRQANVSRIDFGDFKPFDLVIENFENSREKTTFDCVTWKLEVLTLLERNPMRRYAVPNVQQENTLQLGSDPDNLLDVQTARYGVTLTDVSPNSGTIAGGTLVTITGKQLTDGMTVLFGDEAGSDVTIVDESTLTVRSPAHAAGAVSVTVSSPAGGANLPNPFTFL